MGYGWGPPGVGRAGSGASLGARPRRTPGRAPPATLTRDGRGQRQATRTCHLMYSLESAKQSLSAHPGRRRQPQPPHWTCACGHGASMSADASMCSKRACGGVRSAWDDGRHRQHARDGACSMCGGGEGCLERCSAASRARRACRQPSSPPSRASVPPRWRAVEYGPAGGPDVQEQCSGHACAPCRCARRRHTWL